MADRYERIRRALAMGPTPGSREVFDLGMWDVEVRSSNTSGTICQVNNKGTLFRASEDGADRVGRSQGRLLSDAFFIAACDPDTIRELLAERDQLAAELEAVRRDAERYRWLRKGESDDIAVVRGLGTMDYGLVCTYSEEIYGDALDAAIDAAMQRTTTREGKT